MCVHTILGFPDPLPDSQRVSTGIEALDKRLLKWLDADEPQRLARREGDCLVLIDRGERIEAETASDYEDSVRKVLQIAISRDFFARHGVAL